MRTIILKKQQLSNLFLKHWQVFYKPEMTSWLGGSRPPSARDRIRWYPRRLWWSRGCWSCRWGGERLYQQHGTPTHRPTCSSRYNLEPNSGKASLHERGKGLVSFLPSCMTRSRPFPRFKNPLHVETEDAKPKTNRTLSKSIRKTKQ